MLVLIGMGLLVGSTAIVAQRINSKADIVVASIFTIVGLVLLILGFGTL